MTAPLSVQLYTIRDAIDANSEAAFERLAGLGFTTVEPYGFVHRADVLERMLPEFGFSASSAHATLFGVDVEPVFEAANRLGIPTVIDPSSDPTTWLELDSVAERADEYNRIAEVAARAGITIGYHNHWWELESHIDGVSALETLAAHLDPAVILEVDTYWAEVGGVPAVGLLERLGDRVRFLHVKDGDGSRINENQVAVGAGVIPVLDILAAAPGAVRVVELDDYRGDVFDALAASAEFLVANGERLA